MITRSEGKQTLTRRGIKQKYLVTNWITLALSVKMKIDHRDYDGSQEVNLSYQTHSYPKMQVLTPTSLTMLPLPKYTSVK